MIDEDLYRRATSELDSDDRRPHIWARACALANDDPDEARYLYTNLRVEELLFDVARDGDEEPSHTAHADHRDTLENLELAPVDFRTGDEEGATIESARAGLDTASAPLPGIPLDASSRRPESAPGSLKLELDEDDTLVLDPVDVERINDTVSMTGSTTDGRAVEALESTGAQEPDDDVPTPLPDKPATTENAPVEFDELARLVEQYRSEPRLISSPNEAPPADQSHLVIRQGEWRSDELPGTGMNAGSNHESLAATAGESGYESGSSHDDDHVTDAADERTTSGQAAYPYSSQIDVDVDGYRAPLELADNRGRDEFAVYVRGDAPRQAIRQGVSWVAMCLTLPWLIVRGLLGTAIVYALLTLAILTGLLFTALAWVDAGEVATLATRLATTGFVLLALVGLFLIPLLRANTWREDKLEKNGYELVAYVRARSPRRAIAVLDRQA